MKHTWVVTLILRIKLRPEHMIKIMDINVLDVIYESQIAMWILFPLLLINEN